MTMVIEYYTREISFGLILFIVIYYFIEVVADLSTFANKIQLHKI